MRQISLFFRFGKKFWIPAFVLTIFWLFWPLLEPVFPVLAQVGVMMGMQILMIGTWMFAFFYLMAGRVRIKKYKPGDLDYGWGDYRGNERLVNRFKGFIDYIVGQEDYDEMGGEHEAGILLMGPPGVGKSYLAKVLASEAGIPMWSVEAQSLIATFMGIGPLKVSQMFRGARNEAIKSGKGAILFIDEIDSIGGRRAGMMPQQNKKVFPQMMGGMGMGMGGGQILNTILTELDGLTEKRTLIWRLRKRLALALGYSESDWLYPKVEQPRLMVIMATNRPDMLDPALTRRGRIGYHINVDRPNADGLEDIAYYYLEEHKHPSGIVGVAHSPSLSPELIAKTGAGRTPADIKYMLNTAVQLAHLDGRSAVEVSDWMEALAEGTMGSKNPLPLSDEERKLLATHEAGHAIVTMAVSQGRIDPMFLTIERYGRAFGHMYPVSKVQRYLGATEAMLQAGVCVSLGGAAAEEVIAKQRHNSLGGDMPHAWRRLNAMAWNNMLGKMPISARDKELDAAKRHMLKRLMEITKKIVANNREAFDILVPELVERLFLTKDDIIDLIGDKIVPYEFEKISD